jgi:hypothetical protein
MSKARAAGLALLCVILAASSGCGLKKWPEAQPGEDAFALTDIAAVRREGCLFVSAVVSGRARNLERVILEVVQDDCPGCPFIAGRRIDFNPTQAGLDPNGGISLAACGLDPSRPVRWRMTAQNSLASLPVVQTPVALAQPPSEAPAAP